MALQQIDAGQGVGPLPLQFGGRIPHEEGHRLLGTGLEGYVLHLQGARHRWRAEKATVPTVQPYPTAKFQEPRMECIVQGWASPDPLRR